MNDNITLQEVFTFSTSTHSFEIHWTRLGDPSKQPLVFIHGTPWSSVEWHDLASALQSRFCVYLYDHPGFGRSPQYRRHDGNEADLDGSLSLRAEASAALFRHWKLDRPPHVLAHDNGGLVSLRLYLEHEVAFASLCLVDVVALGSRGTLPVFEAVANNKAAFEALPANFVEGLARAYIRSAVYTPLKPEVEDLLVQQWTENGSQGPARFLQEMIQAHNREVGAVEERYGEVGSRIPVKVIWGADDAWLPAKLASDLAASLNAREVVLIEGAGHLVQYDQPAKLGVEVAWWLASQK